MTSKRGSTVPTTGPGPHTRGKSAPGMPLSRKAELRRARVERERDSLELSQTLRLAAARARRKEEQLKAAQRERTITLNPVKKQQRREAQAAAAKNIRREGPFVPKGDAARLAKREGAARTVKVRKGVPTKKPTKPMAIPRNKGKSGGLSEAAKAAQPTSSRVAHSEESSWKNC